MRHIIRVAHILVFIIYAIIMLMPYYNQTIEASLKKLNTTASGLSPTEAQRRLKQYGPNELVVKGEPLWRKIVKPFVDVFMVVLGAAGVISLIHGDTLDAVIIFVIIGINAAVFYVQTFSTERVLRSLKKHSAQTIDVIRGGEIIQIDSTKLVPGDIVSVTEGDKVPADGRLITASNIRVDEAMLTGESEPISKTTEALKGEKEIYERANTLFQGSFIVAGDGTMVVISTGNETEFGQIAALSAGNSSKSPIQAKIEKLIRQIVAVVAGLSVVAFLLAMRNGMDVGESLSFVMALTVSAVPEGLPIAISVILVLGIQRMAKRKALLRNMRAIETLGVLTTIATDKTGTLTKNKLSVREIWTPQDISKKQLLNAAASSVVSSGKTSHDPLDIAILDYVDSEVINSIKTLPFDQTVSMSGNIIKIGSKLKLSVKAAPEALIDRSDLTDDEREEATLALHELTSQGYRVIAVGEASLNRAIDNFAQLPEATRFELVGLLAIADTLRPEAKKSIAMATAAGVTVRMITGDHFETAYHIGRELGMVSSRDEVFDSRKMSVMSDDELEDTVDHAKIFSRVTPEHKYRLLTILKKRHITAMTGDGVNDVPALTNAHVGVTMGSGTEIAKDAGDMILLDDNFKSIVDAMREGRAIVSNIKRMLFYLLSTNSGEALIMIGALILGMPPPLLPVQILWVNLVTDTSMVIPLGLEPDEKNAMERKPQRPNMPILSKQMIIRMLIIATTMTVVTLCLYVIFSNQYGHEYGRTIAFSAIVVMQWANAFNARSDYQSIFTRIRVMNRKFYIGLAVSVALQMLVIFGPLQGLMHITTVSIGDMFITGIVAFTLPIIVDEIYKLFIRRQQKTANTQVIAN